jgi:hypothetical protein
VTYEHVRIGSDTAVGEASLVDSEAGQVIAEAGWNYFLLDGDGSGGVHNLSFYLDVIKASIDAIAIEEVEAEQLRPRISPVVIRRL